MSARAGSRLAYLDNLRIYLTVLVILHHTSIAYGGSGDWAVKEPATGTLSSVLLVFFNAMNQSYFMSAFFLLAGYFTPRALERKGSGSFLTDRMIRLGVPVLVYTTLIVNLNQLTLGVWMRGEPFAWTSTWDPGHLWFLQALLLFAGAYVAFRAVVSRRTASASRSLSRFYSDRFPPDRALIVTVSLLAVLTFIVRLEFPVGRWVFPGFQLAQFVHYSFCFFFGILAYRGEWPARLERAQARRWGYVALGMVPAFFVVVLAGGALEGDGALDAFAGGVHWQALAYNLWESTMLVAMLVFLLCFFREHLGGSGPMLSAIAASVFTVYIIHQPILIAANVLFLRVDLPSIAKFPIVALIVVPTCFVLALLIRKIPRAKRVLG